VLMFDEPVNGLDPEGIRWIRNLMQALAAEGRTVFVSSHLMSEMESTAQDIIVIGRGKLIAQTTIDQFITENSTGTVKVRTPQVDALAQAVAAAGGTATSGGDETLVVQGLSTDQVGDAAFSAGVRLHELSTHRASLEQAFMELTADSVEYQATVQPGRDAAGGLTAGDQPGGGRHAAGAAVSGAPAGIPAAPPPPQETENEHAGRTN
jgi:ABC-2 type transport system ATP-binding protein